MSRETPLLSQLLERFVDVVDNNVFFFLVNDNNDFDGYRYTPPNKYILTLKKQQITNNIGHNLLYGSEKLRGHRITDNLFLGSKLFLILHSFLCLLLIGDSSVLFWSMYGSLYQRYFPRIPS